jgi:YD repeat-containing protein
VVLTTRTTFDSLGRLLDLTYPDGERLEHTYDRGGNLASVTGAGAGLEALTSGA